MTLAIGVVVVAAILVAIWTIRDGAKQREEALLECVQDNTISDCRCWVSQICEAGP
jgi:hypothetical protein